MPTLPIPVVAVAGTTIVTIRPQGNWKWVISQVATEMLAAPIGSTCKVKRNAAAIVPFMVPTGDVASGLPYIDLGPGDTMTVEWTGVPAGSLGNVTVIYEQVHRGQ